MIRPLIFAGTTEGREIALFFNENKIMADVYTATEYGVQVLPEMEYINTHAGRLTYDDINNMLKSRKDENIIIIDATHPYAAQISENLCKSAENNNIKYFRLLRPSTYTGGGIMFEDIEKAAEYLKNTAGNILLAIGSKELAKYKAIGDMTRIYPRVLPDINVIKNILDLGCPLKKSICTCITFCRFYYSVSKQWTNSKAYHLYAGTFFKRNEYCHIKAYKCRVSCNKRYW